MKVLLINSVCGIGSTGRICTDLAQQFEAQGHEVKIAYGRDGNVPERFRKYAVRIGSDWDVRVHGVGSRLFDAHGLASKRATKQFLKWAEGYHPDLLWLHNIHGYYINYELLFAWIKRHPEMDVKWTLHDCWAFTGHCSHFTMAGCDQWKTHCAHCPQPKKYPARLLFDHSSANFDRKRAAFCGVKHMTLVTPSKWLAGLVGESFLKEYPVKVIYNTVDTKVFKPTESDFRAHYGLTGKKIVLGVASPWSKEKGLDDFLWLAARMDPSYQIVLVGLTRAQINALPQNVIGIERTNSAKELAEIYTAADVFVNPTYEDNYPTTNLEATGCGTPVITYNTGGSPESVPKENVVPCGDRDALLHRITELTAQGTA